MGRFFDRIIRAVQLDVSLYEEVEKDKGAMVQAVGVIVLSNLAAAVGTYSYGGWGQLAARTVWALLLWYVGAFFIYVIGTKVFPEPQTRADHGELLRTMGFASAPGLIRVLGALPAITGIVFLGAMIWTLVATVLAVRQALDYQSTLRAVGVSVIGWLIQTFVLILVLTMTSGAASQTGPTP